MPVALGASLPGNEHIHNLRANTPLSGISVPSWDLQLTVPYDTCPGVTLAPMVLYLPLAHCYARVWAGPQGPASPFPPRGLCSQERLQDSPACLIYVGLGIKLSELHPRSSYSFLYDRIKTLSLEKSRLKCRQPCLNPDSTHAGI